MGLNPTTVPIREQKYVPSVIPYIHYITKIPWTSLSDLAKGREAEKEKFNRHCYAAAKETRDTRTECVEQNVCWPVGGWSSVKANGKVSESYPMSVILCAH